MRRLKIMFFENNGRCPVKKYISNLEAQQINKVMEKIEQLEQRGVHNMPPNAVKTVKKIHYLKIPDAKKEHRIFFSVEQRHIAVMLHAYAKKEKTLRQKEINKAKHRLVLWRKHNE